MATVIGDITFPNGTYMKDGQEKTRWLRCGVLMKTDKGFRIKLDCVPVGVEPGNAWFNVFERDGQPQAQQAPAPATQGDPDVPF